ncbi:MAG: CorA family divalent cation transporter, partial [Pelolinea sp.]|nr:CorA family divalent cation transporter [Pelolinea sp.]
LSVVNNRMNEVMKTLTIITTLFMPLTFLTGFFGMNFFQAVIPLEVWTGRIAFLTMTSAIVLIPMGMFLWMRRRAWM